MDQLGANLVQLGANLNALGANLAALGANLDALGANFDALGANLDAFGALEVNLGQTSSHFGGQLGRILGLTWSLLKMYLTFELPLELHLEFP